MIGLTHFTKLREGYGKIIGDIYAQNDNWQNLFTGKDLDWSIMNINEWDISSIINISFLFQNTSFNQNISSWDTANVTNMRAMFQNTPFNQNISSWDTANVTNMRAMFDGSPFNQNISSWDTANVTNMGFMFRNTSFNYNISWTPANPNQWRVNNVTDLEGFLLNNTNFSNANYDKFLIGLKAQDDAGYTLESNVQLDVPNCQYGADPDAVTAHDFLTGTRGWTINDGGQVV